MGIRKQKIQLWRIKMAPCRLHVRFDRLFLLIESTFYQLRGRMLDLVGDQWWLWHTGGFLLLPRNKKEHLVNENRSLNSLALVSLGSCAWKQSHTTSVSAATVLPSTRITTITIIPLSPQTPNNCRAMPFQSHFFMGMARNKYTQCTCFTKTGGPVRTL